MESYIIRIYRRCESGEEKVVGLVEYPENGAVERFSGVAELVKILLSTPQTILASASLETKKTNDTHPVSKSPEVKQHKTLRFRSQ